MSNNPQETLHLVKTNRGFTLIEFIIVIALIGILAAVAVPKFFDLRSTAHEATKERIIGIIRSGLSGYSSDQLAANGAKAFPTAAALTLENILGKIPEGWSYAGETGILSYAGDGSTWLYTSPVGGDASTYTIIAQ